MQSPYILCSLVHVNKYTLFSSISILTLSKCALNSFINQKGEVGEGWGLGGGAFFRSRH